MHIGRLGRAVNVHIIACTQAPSRATIPAELQVNFTACLGLRCRSTIESRQVVGISGCELLPRYGQALLYSAEYPYTILVDVPLIQDIFIKKQINKAQKRIRFMDTINYIVKGSTD